MRAIFLLLLLAALHAGIVHAQPEFIDTRPRVNDTQLRHALQGIRARHNVPGISAVIFDTDAEQLFAVGELEADGAPVSPESRFRVGQLGLLFNSLAVATLVEDGSLPEDGELRRLAPEIDVHNPWSGERPLRVADLLSHRAGLGEIHFRDVYADADAQPLLAGINRAYRALHVTERPGDSSHYSVMGPAIAAYLVEKAAGMAYERVLARLLFEPLQLDGTLGRNDAAAFDSRGHGGWPPRALPDLPLNLQPAGDVWISARDLAVVGRMLLNDGRVGERQVIAPAALEWMESAPANAPELVPGHRLGVDAEEMHGFLFHTRTGALPGFLARFVYSRELGKGYAVLLNHGGAVAALAEAEAVLRGQLFAGAKPAAVPTPVTEPPAQSLEGWYRDVTPELAPRAFYQALLGYARVASCDDSFCLDSLRGSTRLQWFDASRLREEGRWYPGWQVREVEDRLLLEASEQRWQRIDGSHLVLQLLLTALALGGVALAVILLPLWLWSLPQQRIFNYHELVPRVLPLCAVLAAIAFQVALFTADYPALGRVSAPSVTILVLSLLTPVLAVLSVPACVAGFLWKLPRRTLAAAVGMTISAGVVAGMMGMHELVAFQSWNY